MKRQGTKKAGNTDKEMNQMQLKHLLTRLDNAERKHKYAEPKFKHEPKHVALARAKIEAYNTTQQVLKEVRLKATMDAATKVREAIFFGDAQVALAALKAFELGVF